MTRDELLQQMYEATLVGNGPTVLALNERGVGHGAQP